MSGGKKNHSFVYVESKDFAWVPATLIDTQGTKAHVEIPEYTDEQAIICDGGKSATGKKQQWVDLKKYPSNVLPLQNVSAQGDLIEYPDMVEIPFLHEAGILYNLKLRHLRGRPYTRTGDIIIAINPFQWFDDLYTEKKQAHYSNRLVWESFSQDADPRKGMEPHVYEASAMTFKGLAFEHKDQSILVSGESGAGKTETVKICMNHIASVQQGRGGAIKAGKIDPVVQRVLESNPLLEAFGNAKTVRNDNSSRFGKYTQLQFDKSGANEYDASKTSCKLAGSRCEAYLLEKNRVTAHEGAERTYHIFYQLLSAPDAEKGRFWTKLMGKNFGSFKYVGETTTTEIEGKTDAKHFQKTCETLELIKMGGAKLTMLMRAIIVVMQCGNLTFGPLAGDADKSEVTSREELKDLAELMGVQEEHLSMAFTERTMKTRGETYKVPLNAETAKDSADAFAKDVYGKLFLWLVDGINQATRAESNYGKDVGEFGIIGLLDIFGFESFAINRFEQLCINYANEKLQQKFTEDIFRSVQAEYIEEGIALAEITYDDNTDVLDLIEGRTGLCALLNEECVRPKGSDEVFVSKALAENKKSPCIVINHMDRMSFGIHHYAGKVMYSAEFFVQRNQDTLPTDVEQLMLKSSNNIIAEPPKEEAEGGPTITQPKRQRSNIVGKTIWTKYKTQLTTLMTDLRKTQSRYIRCIKPNKAKKPSIMEHVATVEQLRCAGVVAAVTITRSAFPNRLEHAQAYRRFLPLKPPGSKGDKNDVKGQLEELMNGALKKLEEKDPKGNVKKAYVIGKSKIYFRAGALEYLEAERLKGADKWAFLIQRVWRGWNVRKKMGGIGGYKMQAKAPKAIMIQCWMRQLSAKWKLGRLKKKHKEKKKKQKKRVRAAMKIQACARGYLVRPRFEKKLKLMKERERLKKLANDLEEKVREAEMKRLQNVEAAREAAEKEIEEYKEVVREELKSDKEKQKKYAQQQTLIDESSNIIEFLRRENNKLKTKSEAMRKDFKELKDNNKRLQEENEAATSSFTALNDHAKQLNVKNAKLISNVQEYKKKLEKLKDDLKEKQTYYIAEAEARLAAQKRMAAIVGTIQDKCRDPQLIEDAVIMALECEAEAKSERAALEAQDGKGAGGSGAAGSNDGDDSSDYDEESVSSDDSD